MVERIQPAFDNLPAAFDGMRIAIISDLHAGRRRGGQAGIRQVVRRANSLDPDLTVLLGDTVHRSHSGPRYIPLLAELKAKYGVWACCGNHEHGSVRFLRWVICRRGLPVTEWRELYQQAGITLLSNEAAAIEAADTRIWLVGVDDVYTKANDVAAAIAGSDDDDGGDEFHLAITHHPDLIDDPQATEFDLILAGHTHGGQIKIPVFGYPHVSCRKPAERVAGWVHDNGTTMYVTRGVGEGVPLRVKCPRELTLMTLLKEHSVSEDTLR